MTEALRLMAVVAHPDDESLGMGGTLARYAAEGVETHLISATPGQAGRYRGLAPGDPEHPGPEALADIRQGELALAARVLGVREVTMLGYPDGALDGIDPAEVRDRIALHLRRVRPHVVITFAPDGAYGHPDHIAICQLTTAATVLSADPSFVGADPVDPPVPAHTVSKLYYLAWTRAEWELYEAAFSRLVSRVDGVERQATPWPEWATSAELDTRAYWRQVARAVECHASQVGARAGLSRLSEDQQERLWGYQRFYRAYSLVNGGRSRETDLFEGLRPPGERT